MILGKNNLYLVRLIKFEYGEMFVIQQQMLTIKTWPILIISIIIISVRPQCPSGFTCTACNVDGCSECATDVNICDTCNTQYYLTSPTCTLCPTKCLVCSTNTYCDKCTPGYDREYNDAGDQICVFYWWKWFLIVFGTLLGLVLIGVLIWWVRNKLKDEDSGKEVQYEMKNKLENTESNIKE